MSTAYLTYAPLVHLAYNGVQTACGIWQDQKPEHTETIYKIQGSLACLDVFLPFSHGIMLEHLLRDRAKQLSQNFNKDAFFTTLSVGLVCSIALIAACIFVYDRHTKVSSDQLKNLAKNTEDGPDIQLEWLTPVGLRLIQGACIFKMSFELIVAWYSAKPAIFLASAGLILLNLHFVSKLKFIDCKSRYKDAIQPQYDLEVNLHFIQPGIAKSAQKCQTDDEHLENCVKHIRQYCNNLFNDATWKMNYVHRTSNGSPVYQGYEFKIQTKKPVFNDCSCKLQPILQTIEAHVLTDDRTIYYEEKPMQARSPAFINFKEN